MWIILFLLAVVIVLYIGYRLWTRRYNHWQDHGVPCVPAEFPFGNFKASFLMKKTMFDVIGDAYNDFGNAPVVGMYGPTQPCLLVRDADIAKYVLIDNFRDFMDNGFDAKKSVDPLLAWNPFGLKGKEWKDFRAVHTPVMTANKIKAMMGDIISCSEDLTNHIEKKRDNLLNVVPLAKTYLIDAVCKCAYGIEINAWTKPSWIVKQLIYGSAVNGMTQSNIAALCSILLPWGNFITRCKLLPQILYEFMVEIYKTVVIHRRSQNVLRNDLIQHLLEVDQKRKVSGEKGFNLVLWASNLMVFFLDGTETAHIAMTFILYRVAGFLEVQEKLRNEITANGITLESLDYEQLRKLEYLEMVVQECLRQFPPLPILTRTVTKNTKLAGVSVTEGMKILIPAMMLQKDSRYYTNPDMFDPERFSNDRKTEIPKGAYLPFGEGPRICVGMKFAQTAIKVALISLLLKFEFSLSTTEVKADQNSTFFLFPENSEVSIKFIPLTRNHM